MTAPTDNEGTGRERRRLTLLVLLAALVRLPLLLTPGYDVVAYKIWARVVHTVGIGGAYGAVYPPEPGSAPYHYQPLYLYVLRATGAFYAALRPAGDWHDQTLAALLKLSPVLAELALGALIWRFLQGRVARETAFRATAAFLFTPGLIWNSAYWGGIDALQALFLTLGLFATATGATARAWPLATLAVCTKLTTLPGALAVVPPALRPGEARRVAWATAAALGIATLLVAPMLLRGELAAMRRGMFDNLGLHALISFNAHNLWWLLTGGQGFQPDTTVAFLGLSYRQAGRALFLLAAAPALYQLWRRPHEPARLCATSAYLTFAFAMLTTGVHENWPYVLFSPLVVAAALDRRYRPLYAALSATFLANLALHDPPLFALLGDSILAPARALRLANAAAQCALLVWWLWLTFRPQRVEVAAAVPHRELQRARQG